MTHPCETCGRPLARVGDDLCDHCASFGEGPHEAERAIRALEPRPEALFKPGDMVTVRYGNGHVWRITAVIHQRGEYEPGYELWSTKRTRTANESALTLAETAADRD